MPTIAQLDAFLDELYPRPRYPGWTRNPDEHLTRTFGGLLLTVYLARFGRYRWRISDGNEEWHSARAYDTEAEAVDAALAAARGEV